VADLSASPTRPIDLLGSEQRQSAPDDGKHSAPKRPSPGTPQIEVDVELEQDSHRLDERA